MINEVQARKSNHVRWKRKQLKGKGKVSCNELNGFHSKSSVPHRQQQMHYAIFLKQSIEILWELAAGF